MLLEIAGKLRLIANKLACYVTTTVCGGGVCCGGQWHSPDEEGQCCGNVWYTPDQEGECCGNVWYVNNSPCPEGYIFLRWGQYDECCGCVPEMLLDPRVGEEVSITDIKDDLCCPFLGYGSQDLLPFDPDGNEVGCKSRCCDGLICTNEPPVTCQQQGKTSLPGFCENLGCPAGCCNEDSAGNVTCEIVDGELLCVSPRVVAGQDCSAGCLGQCCVRDGDGVLQPQGMMTQEDCDAIEGQWQGIGVETCSACTCRPPFDCACCESVTSTAAGLTFFQPRRKRSPQFIDTFRVTVSGRTESSIYVHGVPVGASCDFEVTFLLCGESFHIQPVACGTNFKKLIVKVCWEELHTSTETLEIRGCETGTIAAGSCRPDGCNGGGDCIQGSECTTTLLHDENGAETNADIQVNGRLTIESSGTAPLVLTGDVDIPATSCSLTIVVTGLNDDLNRIDGAIAQHDATKTVIVEKRGAGLWKLSGANSYTGGLVVLDGTLVVGATVTSNNSTASPVGRGGPQVLVGDPVNASAGVAFLLSSGVTMGRDFTVTSNGTQLVVLGGYSGSSTFGVANVTLNRNVTLQAPSGETVTFSSDWIASAVTFTIGTDGYGGIVALTRALPGSLATFGGTTDVVNVVNGTAMLASSFDNTIDQSTHVTVGSSLGAATLNINGRSQSLDSLSFAASGGTVTSGTLRPAAVEVDGTGHEIESSVSLAQDCTFTVNADSDLTISGVVSGAHAIAKEEAGTLTLSAANTYSGTTTINGGTVVAGDAAAFGTGAIVVNAGGTLNKNGFTIANTITNNGGTVIP